MRQWHLPGGDEVPQSQRPTGGSPQGTSPLWDEGSSQGLISEEVLSTPTGSINRIAAKARPLHWSDHSEKGVLAPVL